MLFKNLTTIKKKEQENTFFYWSLSSPTCGSYRLSHFLISQLVLLKIEHKDGSMRAQKI